MLPSYDLRKSGDGGVMTSPDEKKPRRKQWWTRRSAGEYALALGLLLAIYLVQVLLPPEILRFARRVPDVHRGFDITAANASNLIGKVKWWKCEEPDVLPGTECGYLVVPLDYFDESAGVAQIALARYPASLSPSKGTVLLNPGGPGGPGTRMAALAGKFFQGLIGEDYDLVGFDPRGIGKTIPRTQCFEGTGYNDFSSHTILQRGYDIGTTNASDPFLRERLIHSQKEAEALLKTQFAKCNETMGEQLRYMGTSTVVRDMDLITKALEGDDALINYWGGSYGSILGMYLVNMLPDRVGRVAIDGIVDSAAWANKPSYQWYRDWTVSTEATYDVFVQECSKAGPTGCALAKAAHEDPLVIQARIEAFITQLYSQPLPVPQALQPGILTEAVARFYLFMLLEQPLLWCIGAEVLAQAISGDATTLLNSIRGLSYDLERSAVSCNDNIPSALAAPPSAEEIVDEWLYVYENVTRFAFSVVTTEPDSGCHYWPVDPPERFNGPWNHTLRNPMLVMSSRWDPVTPLVNAEKVQDLLGDSARLVIQETPGHSALLLASQCYFQITRDYYKDGSLPPPGTTCEADRSPFPISGSPSSTNDDDLHSPWTRCSADLPPFPFSGSLSSTNENHARALANTRSIAEVVTSSWGRPFYLDFSS